MTRVSIARRIQHPASDATSSFRGLALSPTGLPRPNPTGIRVAVLVGMLTSNITNQLSRDHHETVVRWATKLTRSRDVGEDVAQDVFIVVERRKDVLAEIDNPIGWLRRITTNLVRHHWRNSRKLLRQTEIDNVQIADGALDPHETLVRQRELELVVRALDTLNPQQRDLVLTNEGEEMRRRSPSASCKETVRPETLRVRRFRARSMVARRVRELEARSHAHTQLNRRGGARSTNLESSV
ncbi:MAG TPA: sigma-70 family RNA polymerase sigma factor [Polyangia bacterium]